MIDVQLVPSWQAAAELIIISIEHGTGEGKKAAKEELRRMAMILDEMNKKKD